MPKQEKKIKSNVVKSLYSHETRKDVNLVDLPSLKLEDAWPFIREEIEKEIGCDQFVCVPYITEANLYQLTSIMLKSEDGPNGKLVGPIGKLTDFVDKEKSDPDYLEWLGKNDFRDELYKFPHESVKITLQDEKVKNKVRVIMLNITRVRIPQDKSPVKKIFVSQDKDLKGVKSVYMITDILMAKTVEFRVNIGTSSRIFHIGTPSPLVFAFEQFDIDENGQIVSTTHPSISTKGTSWSNIHPHDHLCRSSMEHFAVKT